MEGQVIIRDKWGAFMRGSVPNPRGRPKGSVSLKTFAQEFIKGLNDEDKRSFLRMIDPMDVWRMAEGNPHSTEDVRHTVAPTPIMKLETVKVDNQALPLADDGTPAVGGASGGQSSA